MTMGISKKSMLVPLLAMFLMVLTRVSSSKGDFGTDNTHFDFPPADSHNFTLQGDATFDSQYGYLQLTKVTGNGPQEHSVGRALYSNQIHLWEKSAVAGFDTTFNFVIEPPANGAPADGITFFIAKPDTSIPSGSAGKYLGLFPSKDPIVAVELDTYPNTDIGDPKYPHIGIDINSIDSVATTEWKVDKGEVGTAQISYDPDTKELSAVVIYPTSTASVSYEVDLKDIFSQTEWVQVGLSGSTGNSTEINTIRTWSFTSWLTPNRLQDLKIASVV